MRLLNKGLSFLHFQRSILFRYGWIKAWQLGKPVDMSGNPLPWITYPAIDFISQFDYMDCDVFEWGGGYSTLWWSARCRTITTVEPRVSEKWSQIILDRLPPNGRLLQPEWEEEAEARAIDETEGSFDVIVIDNNGAFRRRCAEVALPRLAPGGMIILDNSDQCPKSASTLREAGLTEIDFAGFGPSNGYAWTTSIFFRERLKFAPIDGVQPRPSPGQPNPPFPNY